MIVHTPTRNVRRFPLLQGQIVVVTRKPARRRQKCNSFEIYRVAHHASLRHHAGMMRSPTQYVLVIVVVTLKLAQQPARRPTKM